MSGMRFLPLSLSGLVLVLAVASPVLALPQELHSVALSSNTPNRVEGYADTVWHIETVDTAGDVGYDTSPALDIAGRPHVSHYDVTNSDLYAWSEERTSPTCAPIPVGLVGWWPGEGNADDVWGGNNGTYRGHVSFAKGMVGQAFAFDGSSGWVQIPDSRVLRFNDSFSIEGWVFVRSFPTSRCGMILFRGDKRNTLDPYCLCVQPDGQLLFHVETPFTDLRASIPARRWVHVAAVLDTGARTMKIYIDGELSAEVSTDARPFADLDPSSDPGIGIGSDVNYDMIFDGLVDELSVYARALTADEIRAIFTAGNMGKCRVPVTTRPIATSAPPPVRRTATAALTPPATRTPSPTRRTTTPNPTPSRRAEPFRFKLFITVNPHELLAMEPEVRYDDFGGKEHWQKVRVQKKCRGFFCREVYWYAEIKAFGPCTAILVTWYGPSVWDKRDYESVGTCQDNWNYMVVPPYGTGAKIEIELIHDNDPDPDDGYIKSIQLEGCCTWWMTCKCPETVIWGRTCDCGCWW